MKVLIADADHGYRNFVRRLLATDRDLSVVGEAVDGEEALSLTETLKPDMVVVSLEMPLVDGLEVTRRLKEKRSQMRVVIVSNVADETCRKAAAKYGADAFVAKSAEISLLLSTIRRLR
jgi:two-component system invasion response regulator UvrY